MTSWKTAFYPIPFHHHGPCYCKSAPKLLILSLIIVHLFTLFHKAENYRFPSQSTLLQQFQLTHFWTLKFPLDQVKYLYGYPFIQCVSFSLWWLFLDRKTAKNFRLLMWDKNSFYGMALKSVTFLFFVGHLAWFLLACYHNHITEAELFTQYVFILSVNTFSLCMSDCSRYHFQAVA